MRVTDFWQSSTGDAALWNATERVASVVDSPVQSDITAEFGSSIRPVYLSVGEQTGAVSAQAGLLAPTRGGYHVRHDHAGDGIA